MAEIVYTFFFSSRRRHTRFSRDWSSDMCSSDLARFARLEKCIAFVDHAHQHAQAECLAIPLHRRLPLRRAQFDAVQTGTAIALDRKSTRLNSSHVKISYAVFCLKKKKKRNNKRK